MTEYDLLGMIRNADEKFYQEAEEAAQRTEPSAGRKPVMHRIMAAASAAAVFAAAVFAGIYASRSKGLTVSTAKVDMDSIVEQVTTTDTNAGEKNILGGHGPLRTVGNSRMLWDNDHWYEYELRGALKSDETYLLSENTALEPKKYSDLAELVIKDEFDGTLYACGSISREDSGIFMLNPDGSEYEMFLNIYERAVRIGAPENCLLNVDRIANLGEGKYYLELFSADDSRWCCWMIYDTDTGKCVGDCCNLNDFIHDSRQYTDKLIYSDGDDGVYLGSNEYTSLCPDDHVNRIVHRTADGTNETVLEAAMANGAWFVHNGCIYYVSYGSQDYCKYDMETGETTVILEHTGWAIPETAPYNLSGSDCLFYVNGTVYIIKNNRTLIYGDPDMSAQHEWEIEIPESWESFTGTLCMSGACGSRVFLWNCNMVYYQHEENQTGTYGVLEHDYSIIYHTDTGKVQYICDAETEVPGAQAETS